MTTEVLAQTITSALGADFGQGRVLYVKSCTSPLTIIARRIGTGGSIRKLVNVGAGFKLTLPLNDKWDTLHVTTAVTQAVELIISDDDVDQANAVSVTGVAQTLAVLPSIRTSGAQAAIGAGGSSITIAADLTRRSVLIQNYAFNTTPLYVTEAGGAALSGVELSPGDCYTIDDTAAVLIRNDSAAAVTCAIVIQNT